MRDLVQARRRIAVAPCRRCRVLRCPRLQHLRTVLRRNPLRLPFAYSRYLRQLNLILGLRATNGILTITCRIHQSLLRRVRIRRPCLIPCTRLFPKTAAAYGPLPVSSRPALTRQRSSTVDESMFVEEIQGQGSKNLHDFVICLNSKAKE